MTISYNLDVSSIKWTYFFKIFFRWKASLWKSVYFELATWLVLFYSVMAFYRYVLSAKDQRTFELLSEYLDKRMDYFPLMLMLGFFVATVVDRWKNIFANIGFIDTLAIYVSTTVHGNDSESRMIRRNIIRYCCLTQVLVLRDISMRVRKRFPNLDSVVEAGFLLPHEKKQLENLQSIYPNYWTPIQWVFSILADLKRNNKLEPEGYVNMMMGEVINFRNNLQNLCNYDIVPIPLAYPQCVSLAIRFYFLVALVSRQYLLHPTGTIPTPVDYFVPFMTMFQFMFYIGWLKVAEALLNPLGEDDDDFESNYIIDRNISIGMSMVDDAYDQTPQQMPDTFNNTQKPLYSEEAAQDTIHMLTGSAAKEQIKPEGEEVKMVPHKEYVQASSPAQPEERPFRENLRKRLKSDTQPLFSRKWSISKALMNRKRAPSLQEVCVKNCGKIEFGPKKSNDSEDMKKEQPILFNILQGVQENDLQNERNKNLYLSTVKEEDDNHKI